MPPQGERAPSRGDAQALALTEELGAQLGRMKGAGAKLVQLLSMLAFQRERSEGALGALPPGAAPIAFDRVRRVVEHELDAPVRELFSDFDEEPFALASLGQVHRARTDDGAQVAVKVQHPGVAEAIEADLRNLGLVSPILKRLAPGLDAAALLAEVRELISDELDYELEAQHQRRLERRFRGHPTSSWRARTPASRRAACSSPTTSRGWERRRSRGCPRPSATAWASSSSASTSGSPGATGSSPGTRMPTTACCARTVACACWTSACCATSTPTTWRASAPSCGRSPTATRRASTTGCRACATCPIRTPSTPTRCSSTSPTAGEWLLAPGFRRLGPEDVDRTVELGYPPRSPWFAQMRRLSLPAPTLLLRRMELQVLSVLGDLRAGADWGALAAEHHAAAPASTDLGREDRDFFARRAR